MRPSRKAGNPNTFILARPGGPRNVAACRATVLRAAALRGGSPPQAKRRPKSGALRRICAGAFTLIELLVVIAIIAILASLVPPALARAKLKAQGVYCMDNTGQIALAWIIYGDDNNGRLVYNRDGMLAGKSPGNEAWVGGWLNFTASTDNANVGLLINHERYLYAAHLDPYVRNTAVFKCPADTSTAPMPAGAKPRVRSISMNNDIGTASRTWNGPSRYKLCTMAAQIKSPVNITGRKCFLAGLARGVGALCQGAER